MGRNERSSWPVLSGNTIVEVVLSLRGTESGDKNYLIQNRSEQMSESILKK